MKSGTIVVLNGAPRSGKSSIAAAMQEAFDEPWLNLGVDAFIKPPVLPAGPGRGSGCGQAASALTSSR